MGQYCTKAGRQEVALLQATQHGSLAAFERVVSEDLALCCTARNGTGQAFVHLAARHGHVSFLHTFERALRDAFAVRSKDYQKLKRIGRSPELVLLSLANLQDESFQVPLHLACIYGHADVATLLLQWGATPWAWDNNAARTPLHYASSLGHVECIRALLGNPLSTRPPAEAGLRRPNTPTTRLVDVRNDCGYTPLHYAVWAGCADAVRALVSYDASLTSCNLSYSGDWIGVRCAGCTPLHLAAVRGSSLLARLLLAAYSQASLATTGGTQPPNGPQTVDLRLYTNTSGQLPYHMAVGLHGPGHLTEVLHPDVPLSFVLTPEELAGTARLYGVPKLAVLAASALQAKLMAEVEAAEETLAKVAANVVIAAVADANGASVRMAPSRRHLPTAAAASAGVTRSGPHRRPVSPGPSPTLTQRSCAPAMTSVPPRPPAPAPAAARAAPSVLPLPPAPLMAFMAPRVHSPHAREPLPLSRSSVTLAMLYRARTREQLPSPVRTKGDGVHPARTARGGKGRRRRRRGRQALGDDADSDVCDGGHGGGGGAALPYDPSDDDGDVTGPPLSSNSITLALLFNQRSKDMEARAAIEALHGAARGRRSGISGGRRRDSGAAAAARVDGLGAAGGDGGAAVARTSLVNGLHRLLLGGRAPSLPRGGTAAAAGGAALNPAADHCNPCVPAVEPAAAAVATVAPGTAAAAAAVVRAPEPMECVRPPALGRTAAGRLPAALRHDSAVTTDGGGDGDGSSLGQASELSGLDAGIDIDGEEAAGEQQQDPQQVLRRFRLLELTQGMDVGTLVRSHLMEEQQQLAPQTGSQREVGVSAADLLPACHGVHVSGGRSRAHEGAFSTLTTARPSLDCADGPTSLPRAAGVGGAWGRGLQGYIARRSREYQEQLHHHIPQQVLVSPFAVANASAGGAERGSTPAADAGCDDRGGGGGGAMARSSRPRRLRASSITLAILARRFGLPHPAMIVEEQQATGGVGGAMCGAAASQAAAPAVAMSGERGLDQGLFAAAATAEVLHNNTPVLLSTRGTLAGEVFSSGMLSRVTSQGGAPFPGSAASPCVGCAAGGAGAADAASAGGAGQPGAGHSGPVGGKGHGSDQEGDEEGEEDDGMCGVCFDAAGSVRIERCGHMLCADCSRELVRMNGLRPAQCPFCRACIAGFAVADEVALRAA